MAGRQWGGATFGNGWMHRNLIRLLRIVGVRPVYAFSSLFIVPWCVLFNKSGRSAYAFFHRRLGYPALKSCWLTYRNHCLFSQVVIDRFAMYAGKSFEVEYEGDAFFKELEAKEAGFVMLSSHIGKYEIAGYSLVSDRKGIHAVVYSFEKESVMRNRNSMFGKTNVSMIAMQEDMSHLFEIDQALVRGDIVSFPTDRHMPGSRCIRAAFLGEEASFPQGPFSVATMRGVDVLAVNVMKEGAKKYKIYLKPLTYDRNLPRKEQIGQLCRAYTAELERIVRLYPTQWFNFFDFWAS